MVRNDEATSFPAVAYVWTEDATREARTKRESRGLWQILILASGFLVLTRRTWDAGTDLDLDPLVAMIFAASVSIRVLGRAGQNRRLLKKIAKGTIEAAQGSFEAEKE